MPATALEIEDAWVVYDRGPAMFPGLAYTADGTLLASFSTVSDGRIPVVYYRIGARKPGTLWVTL